MAGVVGEGVFPRGFVSARGWKVLPPAESLEALAARELPPDGVLVVLSHLGEAGDAELARDLKRPALILGAHSGRPSRGPVRGTGSFVLRPRGRGVGIVEIVAGRAGEGRAAAAGGFADAAALEGYREQRRGLAAGVGRMGEERKRIYGNAVLRLDEAIREAEGMRLLEIRDRSLGKEIPDDPGIAAMIAGHVKRFGPLSASR